MQPRTMIIVGATIAVVAGVFALKEYNRGVEGAATHGGRSHRFRRRPAGGFHRR